MKTLLRWIMLRALRDEQVRAEIVAVVRAAEPVPAPAPKRRIGRNTAPGAIGG